MTNKYIIFSLKISLKPTLTLLNIVLQVDFDKVQKVESGWDHENSNEEEDFW